MTEQIKVEYIHHCGSDLSVVNAARVSFDKESKELGEKDLKLLAYLAKHKHLSPFGHCFVSFRVTAPVFVARQLVKHKFLRINEVSRRYVDSPPEFYKPPVWRGRAENVKQGSAEALDIGAADSSSGSNWVALDTYYRLLAANVAPEMARMVLPQSMMTSWWWSGSLDAFAAMCALRCKDDTQWETRQIADQISKEMEALYPVSWKALMDNA